MPPEISDVPPPAGRGGDATSYLEQMGLMAVVPPISSSQLGDASFNEFYYFLRHRLGLIPGLPESNALNRGSWVHTAFQHIDQPLAEIRPRVESLWKRREGEIRDYAKIASIKGDSLAAILDREFKDMRCAVGWFHAALTVACDTKQTTLRDLILGPQWLPLTNCTEVEMKHTPKGFKTPFAVLFDRVCYHKAENSLWLIDYKSTDDPCEERLSYCTMEFQTWLYLFMLRTLIEEKKHVEMWGLPPDTKFGGMIHVAIRKPTINLGMNDRAFREVPFTPSTGKNKGVTRMEKEYYGEPDLDLYIERCGRWYRGVGEFSDKNNDRVTSPPVNYSITHGVLLSEVESEFWTLARRLHDLATRRPDPENFPRGGWKPSRGGYQNDYLPFLVCPFQDWPAIILKKGFLVKHRYSTPEPANA